jgi:plasmid stabilization system protein ParE
VIRTIKLSKRAEGKLDKLLDYLEKEWSLKVKSDFISKLDKSLKQIQTHPESCPQSVFVKGLHMLVVTKHTSLVLQDLNKFMYLVISSRDR